ncbi:hypothetical protein GCM10027610_040680 [Dactylosporangium cerinum]
MNAGPARPAAPADCLTADGRVVRVRPVTTSDMPALLALHEGMSAQNRYLRFFSAGAGLDAEVRRLTRPADEQHLALLVLHGDEVLAAGSYERVGADQADFALLVHDEHHGEGLGTLLLEHLAAAARRQGVTELIGDVLAGNGAMLRVSRGVAPGVPRTSSDPGVVRVRIPTLPDEAALAAVDERDRTAAYQSLRPLLAPASVVVIGAGRQPGSAGHEVLAALIASGYDGELFAVNPRARDVCGLPALPSVALVGEAIDLAIVAVPGRAAPDVLRECCAAGVRAAVVLTSDLDDTVRNDLVRMARRHGMRLVGPDSLGVLNTDPKVRLTATFAATLPLPVDSPSRHSPGRSAWRSWRPPPTTASACPVSCHSATRPTSAVTICWRTGTTTRPPKRSRCTSSRSATHDGSPRSPGRSAAASRCWP